MRDCIRFDRSSYTNSVICVKFRHRVYATFDIISTPTHFVRFCSYLAFQNTNVVNGLYIKNGPSDNLSDLSSYPNHSIGRSDGRCVHKAGTSPTRHDDSGLLGIPRLSSKIARTKPCHAKQ